MLMYGRNNKIRLSNITFSFNKDSSTSNSGYGTEVRLFNHDIKVL